MAGHKREIAPGVWELLVHAGRDPLTQKKRQRSKRFRGGERAAGKALAAFVTEVDKGNPAKTDATLSSLVAVWLTLQEATLSPDTIRTYRGYVKTWIDPSEKEPGRIGAVPVTTLTSGHLRELHAHMAKAGRKPSTIHQVHTIIRGALTFGMERYGLDKNVAAIRKAPKVAPSDVVACTEDELAALLDAAGEKGCDLWAAIAIGATLGRRLGQLCTIRHSMIDLENRTVAVLPTRKSPKAQVLPIDDDTAWVIETRLAWQRDRWEHVFGGPHPRELIADPYLLSFISDGSEPQSDSYTRSFGELRTKLDLGHLHFHCLRHWCATTLIDKGIPLPVVAERLGHSSPAVTARIYAHVIAGKHSEAASVIGESLPIGRPRLAPPPALPAPES
jgi:integrase